MASSSAYQEVRAAIAEKGSDARVEVNQRALIDKILARYASAGAVYRELLQNSNDAEATAAEILISTSASSSSNNGNDGASGNNASKRSKEEVTQIIYRNNGHPFREQDWARLRKIAEGNPDETKVGAFGVGAYTMFSICEEPLVVSGRRGQEQAMFFFWKGDGLWTKTGKAPDGIVNMNSQNDKDNASNWTSFILPSRDPYPVPDLVEFGQFLIASLTFTQCLANVKVYINNQLQMDIQKTVLESHTISTPKASTWWKNDGAVTYSSSGMFTLGKAEDLTQTSVLMSVSLRNKNDQMDTSKVKARYASASVKTKIPHDIEKRMIRVTKKNPPKELTVQIFLDAADSHNEQNASTRNTKVHQITNSFSPTPGSGRIFIGFRTSQTTGFGIHLAAPLMPTVEREAIDFVDPALRAFNMELLEVAGILMRLALEHEMGRVGVAWDEGSEGREEWKKKFEEEKRKKDVVVNRGEEVKVEEAKVDHEGVTIQSSLFSFASYMARGVKNTVQEVIKAVPEILGEDDESTELLNPSDERPLSLEERDAIILMKAYCPRVSTPESLVGQCLAKGFSRCLSNVSPPVLTMSGVVRGVDARLCHHGMEAFGITNVVRRVMLENAREYHTVIATCPTLEMADLIETMQSQVLKEEQLIRMLKWWPKICRIDQRVGRYGVSLKESICFEPSSINNQENHKHAPGANAADTQPAKICSLESILYYTSDKSIKGLPLPDTAIAPDLQKAVGLRNLEDRAFSQWFSPLPFDIWASFISTHASLTQTNFVDGQMRVQVLVALSKHYDSLVGSSAARFVNLLPVKSMYLPIEKDDKSDSSKAMHPSEIYLSSSDLSAFEGLGKFEKVSSQLHKEGISDNFLLALGVRKTISMEFLFLHLETLKWSSNPKSLINYLMSADLSQQDLHKLRCTKYLPAKNDKDSLFTPRELYLPNDEIKMFPFVRFLQWPEGETMSTTQRNFLTKKLGCVVDPPLASVMTYLQTESAKDTESRDEVGFVLALQYLTQRLAVNGIYDKDFGQYRNVKFLPCIRQNVETGEVVKETKAPSECFYNPSALVMGFSVLDPELDTITIATRTKCIKDPPPQLLVKRLVKFVDVSRIKLTNLEKTKASKEEKDALIQKILTLFEGIFLYLSSRTADFTKGNVAALSQTHFIPCESRGQLVFYLPSQVFFKGDGTDSLAESLFKQVEYNTFLSLAGVKAEPTLHELFDLIIKKPDEVLDTLGEAKYKTLLRRIASDPPFKKVSNDIRDCAFLLGYLVMDEEILSEEKGEGEEKVQKAQFVLARAEDIYIVDNAFLRRQFSMLVCPHEQQLEEFYNSIGSKYVSEVVRKQYEVDGRNQRNTSLTKQFASRISERRPLLLSPSVSSRPLVSNAAKLLSDDYLDIVEVDSINAKYTFERSSKLIPTTSCTKLAPKQKTAIFITHNFDWFDVGTAIGSLILKRCQLEDAFFLSSIMEASLETLRHRGFPVDRILRPVVPPPPPLPLPPAPDTKPITEPATVNGVNTNREQTSVETQSKTTNKPTSNQPSTNQPPKNGFESILSQMFPSCPLDVIQGMLGDNPSKEKAREVANELSAMDFSNTEKNPKPHSKLTEDTDSLTSNETDTRSEQPNTKASKKKSTGGIMGRMMGGLRPGSAGGSKASSLGKRVVHQQASEPLASSTTSSPENDAASQQSLEAMLQQSVQSSRSVDAAGIASPETLLKSLPQGIESNSQGCEVIPQQNIIPFKGPYGTNATKNGIRVFNARAASSSFLSQNFDAVEHFAVVIQHLTAIYKLSLSQVAIFYDPAGNTIAFNSNRALYFNVRYFAHLHRTNIDSTCYSYWYTVMAHELAHNLVTAHSPEHGKFTESIIALYLPGFVNLLTQLSKPL